MVFIIIIFVLSQAVSAAPSNLTILKFEAPADFNNFKTQLKPFFENGECIVKVADEVFAKSNVAAIWNSVAAKLNQMNIDLNKAQSAEFGSSAERITLVCCVVHSQFDFPTNRHNDI